VLLIGLRDSRKFQLFSLDGDNAQISLNLASGNL
jgi:hypothetical protein